MGKIMLLTVVLGKIMHRAVSVLLLSFSFIMAVALTTFAQGYPPPPDFAHRATPHTHLYSPYGGSLDRPLLIIYRWFSNALPAPGMADPAWLARLFFGGGWPNLLSYHYVNSYGDFFVWPVQETQGKVNDGVVVIQSNITWEDFYAMSTADMRKTGLEAAASYVDFASFDTNGDGVVTNDELLVVQMHVHPSYDQYCAQTADTSVALQGKQIDLSVAQGTQWTNLITYIHELGHMAFGIPFELYGYGVGRLDPSTATCVPPLDNQFFCHYNAYNKIHLGWIDPTVVTRDGFYEIHDLETTREAFILYDYDRGTNDYFVVENRRNNGQDTYDQNISDEGLVIWRVDEAVFNAPCPCKDCDTCPAPKMIEVMQPAPGQDAWDPSDPTTPERTMERTWRDGITPSRVAVRAIGAKGPIIRAYFDVRGPGVLVDPSTATGTPMEIEIMPGQTRTIAVPVMNTGEVQDAFEFTIVGLPAGWGASTQNLTLGPGVPATASISVTVPADAPGGRYVVQAEGISITDPSVHTVSPLMIEVKPNYDLIVESITTNPVTPVAEQLVDVTVKVTNRGVNSISSTNPFHVRLYKHRDEAPIIGTTGDLLCRVEGLGAGTSHYCTFPVKYLYAGTYKMWAYVDSEPVSTYGQVEETNESNNVFGPQTITVLEAPDLVVQRITTNPIFLYLGPVDVTVTVTNQGAGAAGPFSIDFYRDLADRPTTGVRGDFACPKDGLASGASTTCSGTVTYFEPGTHKTWAQVDTYAQVPESSETNNVLGQNLYVRAKGVLSVQPLETFISSGRQGGPFTPASKKYTLKNTGGSPIDYEVTGSQGWTAITGYRGTLAPQASADVTVYIWGGTANRLTPATYTDTITFTNWTNHEGDTFRSVILTVSEPLIRPDLVATSVSNPPPAARPGSSFTVTSTTLNQGLYDAGPSGTSYRLSLTTTTGQGGGAGLIGSSPVPALAHGASYTGPPVNVLIPAATALGTYYLLACANTVTPAIAETNNGNNCIASSTTVQVTLPDYVETSVSDPPPSAPLETKFQVTDTVTNQGVVAAPDQTSTTRYYLVASLLGRFAKYALQGSRTVAPLGPGGTSTATATLYVGTKVPLGTYHLMACADDTNAVAETIERNNCSTTTGAIQITK